MSTVLDKNLTLGIKQGARLAYTFEFFNDDDSITRGLTDAKMQVREFTAAPTTRAAWSVESGHLVIDEPAGKVTLNVSGDDTGAMEGGGVFDLKTYRGSEVDRHLQGPVLFSPAVTRD